MMMLVMAVLFASFAAGAWTSGSTWGEEVFGKLEA
jgi:hypothetical protein